MLKWSIDEIKNIIDMKSVENCNTIKPLYVRLHNSNFLLFKSIRLAYIGKSSMFIFELFNDFVVFTNSFAI